MAKFTGWKKRYSYLDDYKPGLDGTYVYYGRHYLFQGSDTQLRQYKWLLGGADLAFLALFIVSGCIDAGAIWRTWYVILPFAVEAVAVFLLIWKTLTLVVEKNPVKAYIYKKSVPWLVPCSWILTIAGAVSVVMTLLCMLLNPDEVRVGACIIYMILKLAIAAGGYLFLRLLKRYRWELDPSEELE